MIETEVNVVDGKEYWTATKDGRAAHGTTERKAVDNLLSGRTTETIDDALAKSIIRNHDRIASDLIDSYRSGRSAYELLKNLEGGDGI